MEDTVEVLSRVLRRIEAAGEDAVLRLTIARCGARHLNVSSPRTAIDLLADEDVYDDSAAEALSDVVGMIDHIWIVQAGQVMHAAEAYFESRVISSVWSEHPVDTREVAGSNPASHTTRG